MAANLKFFCMYLKVTILLNYQLKREVSWANLNKYKRILNWRPFMKRVSNSDSFTSDIIIEKVQPRPQGAFPPKPGKSALGTRLEKVKSAIYLLNFERTG